MDVIELVQSLDDLYLNKDFKLEDVSTRLPLAPTTETIIDERNRLEKVLKVVTRKVSELILSNQPIYFDELKRIADLQKEISESIKVCSQGRQCLNVLKNGAACNGLTVVQLFKRRESLKTLLETLSNISNLRQLILQIPVLVQVQKNYPKAIEKWQYGKELLTQFETFKFFDELNTKLNDSHEFISAQIDLALSKICSQFDIDTYNKLQTSYEMLGRSELDFDLQILNSFRLYHQSSLDELKMFLEQELWEVVPVNSNFKLMQLKEFSFLRTDGSGSSLVEEDELQSSDDDEGVGASIFGPVLTNSSLNVLRLFGRYIQMMCALRPISYEILVRIYNLLDYYTITVFKKFGPEKVDDNNISSSRLNSIIKSIRESLISPSNPNIANILPNDTVDPKKTVAIESLMVLVNQLWNLQDYLESLILPEMRSKLRKQFSRSQSIVPDFLKAKAEMTNPMSPET